MAIKDRIDEVKSKLKPGTELLAVSKYHPKEAIQEAYDTAGQRLFAESHAQELVEKYEALPKDIKWHFIGHLQTNKVKYIVPIVELIHSVDSERLLAEIDKQAKKAGRVVKCLLEVHIAEEETKYGFSFADVKALYDTNALAKYENVEVVGLMGMATATDDREQIKHEFEQLSSFYHSAQLTFAPKFSELSMGMSGDYEIATLLGSTLVRVGSFIFGNRVYN
ncbi:MAG: YggS family pyridoxal phosphate-dependent enzyme [Bacteroidales bacterium]|nr:YggS family pyridoxal phosphate-dependent enzyme [Candidatus Scybalocola fimicaballi]